MNDLVHNVKANFRENILTMRKEFVQIKILVWSHKCFWSSPWNPHSSKKFLMKLSMAVMPSLSSIFSNMERSSVTNLKKKWCSAHFKPMDRKAGKRKSNFANLDGSFSWRIRQCSSKLAYTFSRNVSTWLETSLDSPEASGLKRTIARKQAISHFS